MSFQPGQKKRLCFYSTPVQDCNYLAGRKSTTAFLDPGQVKDTWLYTLLSQHGFRRSGKHIYRPNCESCSACVAVRVAVDAFRPRRIQRRIWARNQELTVTPGNSTYREESFLLYHRYLAARHAGGSMENPTRTQYAEFLESGWADTTFFEFRLAGQLVAIAVSDHLTDSLSAVYSFFEPTMQRRSLGVYVGPVANRACPPTGSAMALSWVTGSRTATRCGTSKSTFRSSGSSTASGWPCSIPRRTADPRVAPASGMLAQRAG